MARKDSIRYRKRLKQWGIRNKAKVRVQLPNEDIYLKRDPEYIMMRLKR